MKSLSFSKPHLIIMMGIPGSGKSFFAEHFAETFKAPIVSSHRLSQELFDSHTFNKNNTETVNQVALYMLNEIFKTGRTIIYDGQANSITERNLITKKSLDADYEPLFVWVQTEPSTAKKRATKFGANKPALNNVQFDTELKKFVVPHKNDKVIVISGKHNYASQLKIVLKHLVEPRAQIEKQPELSSSKPINHNILIR
jgi:predicted kinase